MTSIVSYRKASDQYTTYQLATPDGAPCTELCTIDGVTYVAVPDGAELPAQAEQIAGSVAVVALDDDLRSAIKAASPHCRLINERVGEMIRARYSPEDEIKCLRIAPSKETQAWNEYVESCRAWGREQRAALGL